MESVIWVFEYAQGKCRTETISRSLDQYDYKIPAIEDLNSDGKAEVAIERIWSRGGTCRVMVSVIGWEDSQATDYFDDTPRPGYLCPADVTFEDKDDDGLKEIIFTGITTDKAVGGISQKVISVYKFGENRRYQHVSTVYLPWGETK
jgi:hypothetical protein